MKLRPRKRLKSRLLGNKKKRRERNKLVSRNKRKPNAKQSRLPRRRLRGLKQPEGKRLPKPSLTGKQLKPRLRLRQKLKLSGLKQRERLKRRQRKGPRKRGKLPLERKPRSRPRSKELRHRDKPP